MIFGVDYYPEHWDKEEWAKQAKLMREGGFNTVRIGEFAWKLFEPEEGVFDFSLMDEAIEILTSEGINIILGTPTAAPPKWLANKYDVVQRDKYGRKRDWGSRRECCANNPYYIKKSEIIVRKMAEHFSGYKNIISWQIDNEFGCHNSTRCYCDHCRKEFSKWLKDKYHTIENLNKKWGTVFWSLDFDSFDDIILPKYNSCENTYGDTWSHNPSLDLEFRRFSSDSWVKYQKRQIDIIREYSDLPVTHNLMGHFSDIDAYSLSKDLDFVSWDNYPDNQWGSSEYQYVSMAHENMRGAKQQNFIVMEQQAGPAGWDIVGSTPKPGQLRLWTYQAIAHGAEGIVYFRFRTALFGMEQYWYGVLDHDGKPRRRFYELQQTGEELKRLEKYIVGAENIYDVLIVKSYDNNWAHEIKRHAPNYNYRDHLYAYYKANDNLNISASVSNGDYFNYKAVYMIAYNLVDDNEINKIKQYVENGGTLVLTFRSGTRDPYNNIRPLSVPGVFSELAGIEVTEFDALRSENSVSGIISGKVNMWCDIIVPKTAKVISTYDNDYYQGEAAITVNNFGKGKVFYVGCDLDESGMMQLTKYIAGESGIETEPSINNVEIIRRNGYTIALNYNNYNVEIPLKGYDLISETPFNGNMSPFGIVFIK